MPLDIEIQLASHTSTLPSDDELKTWLNSAAQPEYAGYEVCLRIVDVAEITELNAQYRHKDQPTNVLSFPADIPAELELPILGDIVICSAVVAEQAQQQNKSLNAHWAHMCIHGMLHLQGFDHIDDEQAQEMETLEIALLNQLGYPSPYELDE